jgi:hypothetical protein
MGKYSIRAIRDDFNKMKDRAIDQQKVEKKRLKKYRRDKKEALVLKKKQENFNEKQERQKEKKVTMKKRKIVLLRLKLENKEKDTKHRKFLTPFLHHRAAMEVNPTYNELLFGLVDFQAHLENVYSGWPTCRKTLKCALKKHQANGDIPSHNPDAGFVEQVGEIMKFVDTILN